MKEITEYAVLARKLLEQIEEQADDFRSSDDLAELFLVADLHETLTDAAKSLAAAIVEPLVKYQNDLFHSGEGISVFSYTAFYMALEYVTNILDAATMEQNAGFQDETKLMAKISAKMSPVTIHISKPI